MYFPTIQVVYLSVILDSKMTLMNNIRKSPGNSDRIKSQNYF